MSDSGFKERVQLLEYWAPSLLSKLKDLDDLADCILSVWDAAEAHTKQRIIGQLQDSDYTAEWFDMGEVIALIKGDANE